MEMVEELKLKLFQVKTVSDLDATEVEYLGRQGKVNQLMQEMKSLSGEQKKQKGKELNTLKLQITELISTKRSEVTQSEMSTWLPEDTTLPGKPKHVGHLHPTTSTIRDMNSFFRYYGYSVYEGPEIETDEFNFNKLNLPLDHPAREMQDTLYISEPEYLLRTHTSSVETRCMTEHNPPIRIVGPGKCYRNENTNASNNSIFYQYEALCIDTNITMTDLKGTLMAFAKFLYGDEVKTRFRCKYYPQVEPGAGMDIQCTFCHGAGCATCKYRGWLEILGGGMVHPNALEACGIDPDKYTGFAFGMGLDRLVMMKWGLRDIRKLYNGDIVWK